MNASNLHVLAEPLQLRCGVVLKNRIAKSAMSDSLGDGRGGPTEEQARLYECWAKGGAALSIVGEVQGSPHYAEKPGNLVLNAASDPDRFKESLGLLFILAVSELSIFCQYLRNDSTTSAFDESKVQWYCDIFFTCPEFMLSDSIWILC